jgi:putrescine---pyruvate transaminase
MNAPIAASHNLARAHNARHMLHPMTAPATTDAKPPLIVDRGEGSFIYDVDGKRYLDAVAALWNVNLGHNHPGVKRAIVEQLDRIAYYKTFVDFSNGPAIELSRRVMELARPEGMAKLFYCSGGSDAVETAIKLARQYWQVQGEGQRTKILSLKYGYHGVNFGGLSANGNPRFRRAYEPLVPGFFQVESPFTYRNIWSEDDPARLATLCADAVEREIVYQGADTVAAFIAEPVQAGGGVIVPPETYWPLVRQICDRHGVLLIADEVVTGFGRLGTMFGSRAWGVKPDLMVFAKGINSAYVPLGATAVSERVEKAFHRDSPLAAIMHGYTYSGHALACAAGVATMEAIVSEKVVENAAEQGAYLQEGFAAIGRRFPFVGNVRGKGLMAAVELVKEPATRQPFTAADPLPRAVEDGCLKRGVIVRNQIGTVVVSPPLTVSREEIDLLLNALEDSLEEAAPML